jgi:hypothetical protein
VLIWLDDIPPAGVDGGVVLRFEPAFAPALVPAFAPLVVPPVPLVSAPTVAFVVLFAPSASVPTVLLELPPAANAIDDTRTVTPVAAMSVQRFVFIRILQNKLR